MADPKLLTIILNYQTPGMTLRALEAALREMEGISGEVVVVDNDSRDGSFDTISTAIMVNGWVSARVLQAGSNGGFGAGNNVGIRAGLANGSKPDYVYILNSDAFPGQGAIVRLLAYLQDNRRVGFAGSYIHGPEGEPHITAFRFPTILSEFESSARIGPISWLLQSYRVPLSLPDRTCQVDWLAGASLMMRQNVLDEVGLFDEQFFLYFEETDLCLRARKAGRPTVYVRDSHVAHIGSVSTGMKSWDRMPEYWFDSRLHYLVKNHGGFYAALATLAHLVGGSIFRLRCRMQKRINPDPHRFLRDMASHALRKAAMSLFAERKPAAQKETRILGQESK